MTGQFSTADPQRCKHYARFFKHLTASEANLIFWMLFLLVLILLCTASAIHNKSHALTEATKKLPDVIATSEEHKTSLRRLRVKYLSLVCLCSCLSASCMVLECFAAFNIEYCHGEDLMMLYWGFWSILQVGSNIAILGVMLQFWIILDEMDTPSWAIALGTPVLVFAALGFVLKEVWKRFWFRCFKRNTSNAHSSPPAPGRMIDEEKEIGYSSDQVPTLTPLSDGVRVTRISTFWSRDIHYLMSSIINENPNPHRIDFDSRRRLSSVSEVSTSVGTEQGPFLRLSP